MPGPARMILTRAPVLRLPVRCEKEPAAAGRSVTGVSPQRSHAPERAPITLSDHGWYAASAQVPAVLALSRVCQISRRGDA